jgi:hypothetical protein
MNPTPKSPLTLTLLLLTALTLSAQVSVKVFPDIPRQKILTVGGNYCQGSYSRSPWDSIGEFTLREFKPLNVRVALPMNLRRTSYEDFKGSRFIEQPMVKGVMESMKRMKDEFGVKTFTVSVWDVPDELIADPSKKSQRVIKPGSYDEFLDMLIPFLLKAKKDYGVEADYFSFNESDGGWQIIFSPEAAIEFFRKAGKRFEEAGLKTKFLLADTAQTKGTVDFATLLMADSTLWDNFGPLSFHCWWSEDLPDSEFERVAAFARSRNKPVWCAELGFNAMAHTQKGVFQSWDYALRLARITQRTLKYAQAEVTMYWTWQNNYPIMSSDCSVKYPSYYVTKQQVDYLNTGTQIVHSLSSDPEVFVVAGIHPDGSRVLWLVNMKKSAVSLTVSGFEGNSAEVISTTAGENWKDVRDAAKLKNSLFEIKLEPESVNTCIIR